jgi:SAM-dependent methyltransferase/tetratricopeptide (TPR) repeat protein
MGRKDRRANARSVRRSHSSATSLRAPQFDQIKDLFAQATVYYRKRDFASARSLCRAILQRNSQHVRSLVLLGDMAQQEGSNNQAIKFLNQALALDSQDTAAHDNLAIAHQALGRRGEAVRHFMRAIALGLPDPELLVKQSAQVAVPLKRCLDAWPRHVQLAELCGAQGVGAIANEALLLALMQSKPVFDIELERLFTTLRRDLLRVATAEGSNGLDSDELEFYCALAQQCFINEYVFALRDGEREQLQKICDRISDALATGGKISVLDLIVIASYLPLHGLPMASSLLDHPWPGALERLLTQQVREPLEEKSEINDIPALTAIDSATSLQVQEQYEENPYPRWIILPSVKPTTIADYLLETIGLSSAALPTATHDVLIAGCGTGFHSIETAQLFPKSHILAVDISGASLAYARRKTRAVGLSNIEYGQADILKLGSIDRRFDLIETVGVLHHLSDPELGWRILLSLLRPKGLMLVGLYSALARRSVTATQRFIAEHGYRPTVDDIRTCRQNLIVRGQVPPAKDFWSVSGCRDLMFNVMEHQFTIPQIKTFLDANRLAFLGFEQLPAGVLRQFQHQFPDATAQRDLAAWHDFEQAHPRSFINMYVMWVQKED